jgi:hypothetical protein
MKIATGEIEEKIELLDLAKTHMRAGGLKGGRARAESLTKKRRAEIAKKAARTRWRRSK